MLRTLPPKDVVIGFRPPLESRMAKMKIPVQSVLASVDQATGAAGPSGPCNFSVFVQAGAGGSVGGTIQGVDVFSLYLGARLDLA